MLRPLIGVTLSRFHAAAMACHCWTLSPRSYFLPRYWNAERSSHAMPILMVVAVTPRAVGPPLSVGAAAVVSEAADWPVTAPPPVRTAALRVPDGAAPVVAAGVAPASIAAPSAGAASTAPTAPA